MKPDTLLLHGREGFFLIVGEVSETELQERLPV